LELLYLRPQFRKLAIGASTPSTTLPQSKFSAQLLNLSLRNSQ
jgi:hypothetical protein